MAEEWRPGLLSSRLAEVRKAGEAHLAAALQELAHTIERDAILNAAQGGSHRYGEATPATRGAGPAIVSGSLRRAIVTTRLERTGTTGFEVRVGMAAGVYPPKPPYPKSARTPVSLYAKYLDQVLDYPFLTPAYRKGIDSEAPRIWRERFRTWPTGR